jgi:hypothetical protein
MILKISHAVITKFATVPNNDGASAIFRLLQARPAILEKRLQLPAAAAAAAVLARQQQPASFLHSSDCNSNRGETATRIIGPGTTNKRRRL